MTNSPCMFCQENTLERKISKLVKVKKTCKASSKDKVESFIRDSTKELKDVKDNLSRRERK